MRKMFLSVLVAAVLTAFAFSKRTFYNKSSIFGVHHE